MGALLEALVKDHAGLDKWAAANIRDGGAGRRKFRV